MIRRRCLLLALLGLSLARLADAGIFSRKPKQTPQRAQELVGILKTDPSESKRAAAADELGSYDLKAHPEVLPVLLQALQDPAAEVRIQAVQTLGKFRPVSVEIGMALEQTLASDSSQKVRNQARSTLWWYHLAGYRTPKNPTPPAGPTLSTNQEPPLADPTTPSPRPVPPRLVPTPTPPKLQPPTPAARPLPGGPAAPALIPGPTLVPLEETGPVLSPPKF
jgi:hypothetical protein